MFTFQWGFPNTFWMNLGTSYFFVTCISLLSIYRHLVSHEYAWNQTLGYPGFPKTSPPSCGLIWAMASSKHATSWMQSDTNGLATIIDGLSGAQYWVVCSSEHQQNSTGDLASMYAYGDAWKVTSPGSQFKHEAFVIRPGSYL
jgi:hypothetical protein